MKISFRFLKSLSVMQNVNLSSLTLFYNNADYALSLRKKLLFCNKKKLQPI